MNVADSTSMSTRLILKQATRIAGLLVPISIAASAFDSALAETNVIKTTKISDRVTLVNARGSWVQKSRDGRYIFLFEKAPPVEARFHGTEMASSLILIDTIKGTAERIGTKEYPSSRSVAITEDGRYVVYSSKGLGVVIYDRTANQYRNVVEDDDKNTGRVRVSENGRYIAFETSSTYLERSIPEKLLQYGRGVHGGRHNEGLYSSGGAADNVLLFDTVENKLQLISKSSDGLKSANGPSILANMSRDGRYIVFASGATDLLSLQERKKMPINPYFPVNPLTGEPTYLSGVSRFYIYDRQTGLKRMVEGQFVSMSDDGRYYAMKLHRNKDNQYDNIAIYDFQSGGINTLVKNANGFSGAPMISGDGRYLIFKTNATNLDKTVDMRPARLINTGLIGIVKDLQTGTNRMLTIDNNELMAFSSPITEITREKNNGYACETVGWLSNNGSQAFCMLHNSSNFLIYTLKNGRDFQAIKQLHSGSLDTNLYDSKGQDDSLPEGSSGNARSSAGPANRNETNTSKPLDPLNQTIQKTRQLIDQFRNLFR